jgi:hypothetical protein
MQIEISQQTEATLKSLMANASGSTPEELVELAVSEFADRHECPDEYLDPVSGESFGIGGLREKLAQAEAASEAGDVREFRTEEELRAYFDDVDQRGRERLARKN